MRFQFEYSVNLSHGNSKNNTMWKKTQANNYGGGGPFRLGLKGFSGCRPIRDSNLVYSFTQN